MLVQYKKKTYILLGVGIALALLLSVVTKSMISIAGSETAVSVAIVNSPNTMDILLGGFFLVIISWLFILGGCVFFAKGKGYRGLLGGILGIFYVLGPIILFLIKDKHQEGT